MLRESGIEPKMSEWTSTVVFVSKEDGKLRFCVKCKKHDGTDARDTSARSCMEQRNASPRDAGLVSTADRSSGYWQTEIRVADPGRTFLFSQHDFFRLIRMLSGLKSAPASLQQAVDTIWSGLK